MDPCAGVLFELLVICWLCFKVWFLFELSVILVTELAWLARAPLQSFVLELIVFFTGLEGGRSFASERIRALPARLGGRESF